MFPVINKMKLQRNSHLPSKCALWPDVSLFRHLDFPVPILLFCNLLLCVNEAILR